AWAKVERAREHRDLLNSEIIAAFREPEQRPWVGTKYEEETGDHVVYVTRMPDLSGLVRRASLLFGDSIHNLRSALDHTVYELALLNSDGEIENPRRLAFPITDSEKLWKSEAYRLRELTPDDAAVVQWYQPYEALLRAGQPPGARTLLGMLRDLDDWDKHRLLTTVAVPDAGLADPHPQAMAIWTAHAFTLLSQPGALPLIPVELGTVLARTKFPDGVRLVDMDMAGYVAGRIHLADGNRDVIEVLDGLAERVTEIVRRFAPE
ncbi:MAG: hypothetical protein WD533_02530, partial [Dehalococcoidia bacterium]